MYCEICDAEIEVIVKRFENEPFLDGRKHEHICMLCVSVAQSYYGPDPQYGTITGLISGSEGLESYGFNPDEVAKSLQAVRKHSAGKIVTKARAPVILSVLILPTQRWLNLGSVKLIQEPDSEILTSVQSQD
jgi:hypothetical protein